MVLRTVKCIRTKIEVSLEGKSETSFLLKSSDLSIILASEVPFE